VAVGSSSVGWADLLNNSGRGQRKGGQGSCALHHAHTRTLGAALTTGAWQARRSASRVVAPLLAYRRSLLLAHTWLYATHSASLLARAPSSGGAAPRGCRLGAFSPLSLPTLLPRQHHARRWFLFIHRGNFGGGRYSGWNSYACRFAAHAVAAVLACLSSYAAQRAPCARRHATTTHLAPSTCLLLLSRA